MKKQFFKIRTPREILKLDTTTINEPKGLVKIIDDMDKKSQAIILDFKLMHPDFNIEGSSEQYISRITLRGIRPKNNLKKYPSYLRLNQPKSRAQAYAEERLPISFRNLEFLSMKNLAEEENYIVGYMRRPIVGLDRSPLLTSFWSIMNGAKMDGYNSRICSRMPPVFNAGTKVKIDHGPTIFVEVPSSTKGKSKYPQQWLDVATDLHDSRNRIKCWSTKPTYGRFEGDCFIEDFSKSPESTRYNYGNEGKFKDGCNYKFQELDPKAVAGYYGIIRHFRERGNLAPLTYSQFAIPSRSDVIFWNKLENNVLIKEVNLSGKEVFRHPRMDQLSMLFARWIAQKMNDETQVQETMYWDPSRDGKISDYPWLKEED